MSMLLEYLAEETSASNRRTADRLDAEARELEEFRRALSALDEQRHRIVESARQATEHVISRLPQAESVWRSALDALRRDPTKERAERLLHLLLEVFETGLPLVCSARDMWKFAKEVGITPERFDELENAERRFKELAAEAKRALEHRTQDWRPADPDRLALGLQLAREGKTVKADEALARFHRTQS